MGTLQRLLNNNREWVAERVREDPDYFKRLARLQQPQQGVGSGHAPDYALTVYTESILPLLVPLARPGAAHPCPHCLPSSWRAR